MLAQNAIRIEIRFGTLDQGPEAPSFMRTQRSRRVAFATLALLFAAIAAPRAARAEPDTFGVGNGHDGAYVAAAADEVINAYAPLTADAAAGATSITIALPSARQPASRSATSSWCGAPPACRVQMRPRGASSRSI
jgi:hypothetical protein